MTQRMPALVIGVVVMALALVSTACGGEAGTSGDLVFTDVWSRQPAAGQANGVVYGTVTNEGDRDVRIVGVSAADVAGRAELHLAEMQDGLMVMREQPDGFVVPAGGTFVFEPGGPHVMLMGIDPVTYPSDAVDVTFEFDAGEPAFVTASVRSIEG